MPTNSIVALAAEFTKITVAGTDISTYLDTIKITYQRDKIDVTSFAAGGNPVTRNNIRGAQVSDLSLTGPYDPAFAKLMELYIGSRTGVQVKLFGGSNTLPAQGDEVLSGYFSIFGYDWPYAVYNKSTLKFDLKIPDGALAPVVTYGTI